MLIIISMTLIAVLTCYVAYFTFRNRKRLTSMAGMMISMTNSMMASLAIGTILGILFINKDLTLPTIASVTIGMIIGFITGRPISLMASLDGLTAGIMGGMMGSMLGVMLQPKSIDFMIYFIDIVFVVVMVLLIRLIDEESQTNKRETSNKKPLIANPVILLVLLLFMGVFVFGSGSFHSSKEKEINFTDTSSEVHEIMVKPTEYAPNNIIVKAGTPSIINFKTKELSCTGIVLSEELGLHVKLKPNANNYININALQPGTYEYVCGMNMYKGTITVEK